MKIKYYGQSCFSLGIENGPVIITDPFDETVTYPPCTAECDIALVSHDHFDHNHTQSLSGKFETVRTSGEHVFGDVKITGVDTWHDPEGGRLRGDNRIYIIEAEGLRIGHMGDMGHMPDPQQRSALTGLDVLMIPVGGFFTIDTAQAEEIIRDVKPRVAIAMHFLTPEYEIPISTPDAFEQDMQAARMSREIEITRDNIGAMPSAIIMAYK